MIVAALSGGLGNQMFQYAAARAVSIHKKQDLFVDLQWYAKNTARQYRLSIFSGEPKLAPEKEIDRFNRLKGSKIERLIYSKLLGYSILKENGYSHQEIENEISVNTYMRGYWQTEKYFKDVQREIRMDFQFKDPPDESNVGLMEEIESINSISIHVRRGDYVSDAKTHQYHGICDMDYYQKAINHFMNKIDKPRFFLFSDDPRWVKEQFCFIENATIINHNTDRAYEDMRLMSCCRHNIIANSSFSWWAAWLNKNQDKMVIAPRRWFAGPEVENRDIIPSTWIAL